MYPCIPQFCYIKVGFKGVYITRTCFPDALVPCYQCPDLFGSEVFKLFSCSIQMEIPLPIYDLMKMCQITRYV